MLPKTTAIVPLVLALLCPSQACTPEGGTPFGVSGGKADSTDASYLTGTVQMVVGNDFAEGSGCQLVMRTAEGTVINLVEKALGTGDCPQVQRASRVGAMVSVAMEDIEEVDGAYSLIPVDQTYLLKGELIVFGSTTTCAGGPFETFFDGHRSTTFFIECTNPDGCDIAVTMDIGVGQYKGPALAELMGESIKNVISLSLINSTGFSTTEYADWTIAFEPEILPDLMPLKTEQTFVFEDQPQGTYRVLIGKTYSDESVTGTGDLRALVTAWSVRVDATW